MSLTTLIANKDLQGIRKALSANSSLANEGLPFDEKNRTLAHPLHRICDAVFANAISDEVGVEIARIFIEHGADVNGGKPEKEKDSPLTAAASLHATKVGLLLIDKGADIHHGGCSGGTALHWAAWTGKDELVSRLIKEGSDINRRCIEHRATPLGWATHGYKFWKKDNSLNRINCVKLLIAAGADKSIPNILGELPIDFLDREDEEMLNLLR